jgi:hypothetical protein
MRQDLHMAELMAPADVAYFPVMHGVQEDGRDAPLNAEYLPAEQGVHVE